MNQTTRPPIHQTTINGLLDWAADELRLTSPTPRLDAELLLGQLVGLSRSRLLTLVTLVPPSVTEAFQRKVLERATGKPVAYLLQEKEFYGRSFYVDERVLVPRPETELLIELVLDSVVRLAPGKTPASSTPGVKGPPTPGVLPAGVGEGADKLTVVDIGTGSGNIIVTLAAELQARPNLRLIATDISAEALEVAKLNAHRHGILDRITFLEGSLLEPLHQLLTVNCQLLIVANLPYVADHWVNDLAPDIKYFEPKLALAGGPTGLELYEQLFAQLRQFIVNCQLLPVRCYVEHDPRQLEALQDLIYNYFARKATSHLDLAQLPRVLEIKPA